jgi:hypothetical protein
MTVSRPDDADIRVTVTGPIGLRETSVRSNGNLAFVPESAPSDDFPLGRQDPTHILALNRRVIARVETRAADHVSDLDWQTVHMRELTFGGVSPTGEWAWTGVVPIGAKTGPARPGDARQWRVTVEEREGIEADPEDLDENGPLTKEWRLIYADQTML